MSNTVIKVENLSKQYRLGEVGTGTISHDLNRWWAKVRGKEDPFLKIGETNDRTSKGSSDYVWALKDINFDIQQGDAVGIIGRNGAGKSTLLKILSKTTTPTTGSIKIKGRIASLLEVGTGFHPEMTGRENIFLNGAILGMRKKEIARKFDEIVDFAGVERYIDTPVKRYSSGMYVRLAFAVAAHLESEILIVDEVLAVGDAEFQKKCLGKMSDVSKGEGRTVLFVSHNMGAVKTLCDNAILLEFGQMKEYSDVDSVLNSYFKKNTGEEGVFNSEKLDSSDKLVIKKITLQNQRNEKTENFRIGDDIIVNIEIESEEYFERPNLFIGIRSKAATLTAANTMFDGTQCPYLQKGMNTISVRFKKIPLLPKEYYLNIGFRSYDCKTFLITSKEIGYFNVISRMADLGITKPYSEEAALDSVPPFIPYEWNFGNNNIQSFNINDYVK